MNADVTGVVVAGGKATRMGELAAEQPKALLNIGGEPLLQRELRAQADAGIRRVWILGGHLHEQIANALPRITPDGLHVELFVEQQALGSGGGLWLLPPSPSTLLVVLGDVLIDMDYMALLDHHRRARADATLVVHPNDHPSDSDLIDLGLDGRVTAMHRKPHAPAQRVRNNVAAGVVVLERSAISRTVPAEPVDLMHDVMNGLIDNGSEVVGYRTTEYLKDVGTPDRYSRAQAHWSSGHVAARRRHIQRPTAFVDRDGTMIEPDGYINHQDRVGLLPGVGRGIALLNEAGILVVVVSNQPQIARGELTEQGLHAIEAELDHQLGAHGAFVDASYHCPHHPDAGFPEEVPELKISCICRKPGTGMLQRAIAELPIDGDRLFMIGDTWRDQQTAEAIGATWLSVAPGGATFMDAVSRLLASRPSFELGTGISGASLRRRP